MILGVMGPARSGKDTLANYVSEHYGFVRIGLADPMKRFIKEVFDFTDEQLYGDKRDEPDPRYLRDKRGSNGYQDVRAFRIPNLRQVDFTGTVFAGMEHLVEFEEYKGEILAMLPSPPEDVYLTPRYALQKLGTEWGRHCYENVWIDEGIRTAKALLSNEWNRYNAKRGLYGAINVSGKELRDEMAKGVVFSDLRFKNEFDAVKAAGGILVRIYRPGNEVKVGIEGHQSEEEQKTIPDEEFDFVLTNPEGLPNYYKVIDELAIKMATRRTKD